MRIGNKNNTYQLQNMNHGFTMIELLIVLAIMSTLLGLVGPLAINSFKKAQAKTEIYQLNNFIKKLSYEAFAQGQEKHISLEGSLISVYTGKNKKLSGSFNFEHLFFQPQTVNLNSNGFTLSKVVDVQITGKSQVLELELAAGHNENF